MNQIRILAISACYTLILSCGTEGGTASETPTSPAGASQVDCNTDLPNLLNILHDTSVCASCHQAGEDGASAFVVVPSNSAATVANLQQKVTQFSGGAGVINYISSLSHQGNFTSGQITSNSTVYAGVMDTCL